MSKRMLSSFEPLLSKEQNSLFPCRNPRWQASQSLFSHCKFLSFTLVSIISDSGKEKTLVTPHLYWVCLPTGVCHWSWVSFRYKEIKRATYSTAPPSVKLAPEDGWRSPENRTPLPLVHPKGRHHGAPWLASKIMFWEFINSKVSPKNQDNLLVFLLWKWGKQNTHTQSNYLYYLCLESNYFSNPVKLILDIKIIVGRFGYTIASFLYTWFYKEYSYFLMSWRQKFPIQKYPKLH